MISPGHETIVLTCLPHLIRVIFNLPFIKFFCCKILMNLIKENGSLLSVTYFGRF